MFGGGASVNSSIECNLIIEAFFFFWSRLCLCLEVRTTLLYSTENAALGRDSLFFICGHRSRAELQLMMIRTTKIEYIV